MKIFKIQCNLKGIGEYHEGAYGIKHFMEIILTCFINEIEV